MSNLLKSWCVTLTVFSCFVSACKSEALPGTADYILADAENLKDTKLEINVSDVEYLGKPLWVDKTDYTVFKVTTAGLNSENKYESGGEINVAVKKQDAAAFVRLAKNAKPPIDVKGIGLKCLQTWEKYIEVTSFSKKQQLP